MACPVYGSDGSVSNLWLVTEAATDGREWVVLRWSKRTGRRLFAASDVRGHVPGGLVTLGDCRLSFDHVRRQIRIDYEPTVGPDHGLRLWVNPADFEKLLAGDEPTDES